MTTTIAVAMPATANAPAGPRRTMSSTRRWSASSVAGSVGIMRVSFGEQGPQLAYLRRRHRGAAVVPRHADVGHDGRGLGIVQDVRERRHSVRSWVLLGARRIAAVQHHANRIDGR